MVVGSSLARRFLNPLLDCHIPPAGDAFYLRLFLIVQKYLAPPGYLVHNSPLYRLNLVAS
jgi:hypothetical protein